MSDAAQSRNCLNCGAPLAGQYCGQCGQRATSRFISLWELIRDAFGDLFELDSRLWRTLIPLMIRPGLLTKDYLEGRRARYMPPFRMYLVLSLLFFAVAFFDPREDLAILYEPVPADVAAEQEAAERAAAEARHEESEAEAREVLQELVERGVIAPEAVPPELRDDAELPGDEPLESAGPDENAVESADEQASTGSDGFNVSFNGDDTDCSIDTFEPGNMPVWLQRRLTPERLQQTCERIRAAGKRGVVKAIVENIPAALILLLPIMALVLKFLYPLSRRYYVEHLLFFVHFHAFFFLMLVLQILLLRLGSVLSALDTVFTVIVVAASLYIPAYLFLSMRRVYGQGRFLTSLKFIVLSAAYIAGFTLVMIGAMLIALFSV